MDNCIEFINKLLANYEKLKWERHNQEMTVTVGNTKIRLDSGKEGTFLQIIPVGRYNGPSVDGKVNAAVADLYDKVWKHINKQSEDYQWKKALLDLNNILP